MQKVLHSKKSPDSNNITVDVFKINNHIIGKLINNGIESRIFPKALEYANFKPIFEDRDSKLTNNYRPISLLNIFSKIFLEIFKSRLFEFLNRHKIIDKQFGFREDLSMQNAILELTSKMYRALDQKMKAIRVFLDLSKPFDTVKHDLLTKTLKKRHKRHNRRL